MDQQDLIKITLLCTVLIYLKYLVTVMIQGGKRFKGGTRPPEDSSLSMSKGQVQNYGADTTGVSEEARELDLRWQRIVGNDLENLPLGVIIAWATTFTNPNPTVQAVNIIAWTVFRFLHTITYAKKVQPWRAIAYTLGQVCVISMLVNGAIAAF
mmetsp:Transcript_42682/g.49048  ORF Transcript_42682/g.49048 Transcript_42682/m.49048 type:complete len:154 (-) Transcript_42682:1366-1827(-)|eukprot:CAMPEP_0115000978 /NCGR_PEP_ID=MMETSP0216-20121206/17090_1 /TAXON_ID=223996 /ORGANISM="Protocruzia adherens, Strain Boccale" /LENGTH=153 /DNA_ID=CAMNT_0002366201 /DNA_START=269 /DNA_END=730 /DNA_ORIENTATION=+